MSATQRNRHLMLLFGIGLSVWPGCRRDEQAAPPQRSSPTRKSNTPAATSEPVQLAAPATSAVAPVVPTGDEFAPPFSVSLTGPDKVQAGTQIDLQLVINRRREPAASASVVMILPAGAKLLTGLQKDMAVALATRETVRRWRIQLDQVPRSDLLVTVIVRGAGYGFSARPRYQFGRSRPTLVMPATAPPARRD